MALALTGLKEHERVINRLLTREQYVAAIGARNSAASGGSSTESITAQSSTANKIDEKASALTDDSKDNDKRAERTEDSSVVAEDSKVVLKRESDENQGQEVDVTDSKCTDSKIEDVEPCCKKAKIEEDKS